MNVLSQIVVVSPDMESRRSLATILTRLGFDPICISTVGECRVMLAKENVGLVFCDRDLADGNYRDILVASRATKRQPGVVLTGQRHNCDENHEAIGFGVFGVTATPYHPTDVEWMVIQARRYQESRESLLILLCLVLASASRRRNLPTSSRVLSALLGTFISFLRPSQLEPGVAFRLAGKLLLRSTERPL